MATSVVSTSKTTHKMLGARCVALNERDGRVATLCADGWLIIHAPAGSCGVVKEYSCNLQTKGLDLGGTADRSRHRVRYIEDTVYIFHWGTKRIHCFVYDGDGRTLSQLQTLSDEYFVQAAVDDFTVAGDMLLILFDKWIGAYTLYPQLTWFHVRSLGAHAFFF